MSSRAKRFAVMALAVVLALALVAGMALAFGGTRNAYAATDVLTLDFDGTQAKIDETNAAGSAEGDANGVFTGTPATGYTAWSNAIAHEGTLTIELGEAITAADYPTVNIHMVVGNWIAGNMRTVTAYAADDTSFTDPAGSAAVPVNDNVVVLLTLDTEKLAVDGQISAIVLRATDTVTTATGQFFFDYVQFFPASASVRLDFDGMQATIEAEKQAGAIVPDNEYAQGDTNWGVFPDNTGETKLTAAVNITGAPGAAGDENRLTVTLSYRVPVAAYPNLALRLFVGGAAADTVTTGYAVEDTEFAAAAGSFSGVGNGVLTMDTAVLDGDEDGYVDSFVLVRTSSDVGQYFFDYVDLTPAQEPDQPQDPDEPLPETVTLDFDGTQAKIAEETGGSSTTEDSNEAFGKAGDYTGYITQTDANIANGGTVVLELGTPFAAADYPAMNIRMSISNWTKGNTRTVTAYAADDTSFTDPVGSAAGQGEANTIVLLQLDTEKLAVDGQVSKIVLRVTDTDETAKWQLFFDYVYLYTPAEDTRDSKYFQAGELVTGANPAGIKDDNVTWLTFRDHPKFDSYGLNEHNALSDIKTKSEFATAIKDCPTYTVGSLEAVRANKLVWALDAGGLDAANYAQVEITLFFTDWCTPSQHQFYVYGSGTTSFTNASGEAEGYAAEFTTNNPSQMYTIKIDNVADLADENGEIGYIYILWWGNTLDTEDEIVGTFNGTQFWLNNVNFLIQEDVESPIKSEEYIEKDLSELLPVGDGVAFDLVSNGATSDEEGYGAMKTMASVSVDAAYDVTEFTVTPTYTTNFSFYIVFKAPSATTTYDVGGITLWIAADNTLIASSAGEGKYAMVAQKVAADYNGAFASGQPTKVRMEMIPGYLEGVQSGYFLYVYLNDGEEAFLSGYIENADVSLGDYINIVYQDLGSDYSVVFGSASDTPTAAADVMEVTVSTNSGSTEFTTPRAKLNLDHMQVEGEQVSDLIIEGDATYNAENGFLTFNSNGTVKVHYTVTNAFGTFTSNTLELTYTGAGGTDGGDENGGGLTTGAIVGIVVAAVVVVAAAIAIPAVIVRKKKNAK